jgi:hypothetical protein
MEDETKAVETSATESPVEQPAPAVAEPEAVAAPYKPGDNVLVQTDTGWTKARIEAVDAERVLVVLITGTKHWLTADERIRKE